MKKILSILIWGVLFLNIASENLLLHYHRYDNNYDGWGLHIWGSGYDGAPIDWGKPALPTGKDDYGMFWEIQYKNEGEINFIIHKGDEKDPDGDRRYPNPEKNKKIWTITQDKSIFLSVEDAKSNFENAEIPDNVIPGARRINYFRFDDDYTGWGLHVWGSGFKFAETDWNAPLEPDGKTENGMYWDVPYLGHGKLNFIIHKGDEKDTELDRTFPNAIKNNEIWTITQDPNEYLSFEEAKKNLGNKIEKAEIISENQIKISFRLPVENKISLFQNDIELAIIKTQNDSENKIIITTANPLDATQKYEIKCGDMNGFTQVTWQTIDALYFYEGELGCFHTTESTEFKLWSPLASKVTLMLFKSGQDEKPYQSLPMKKTEKGVWNTVIHEDLLNQYYSYEVTNNGVSKIVLDPYAKSMAAFDSSKDAVGKAAIIAPDKIGPKLEYIDIEHFSKREDAIIYEVHVRDFTSDPDIATKAQFGTYKAFIEKLPHIKNLGATHVQLLPIMNYYFGNELENSMRELEYSSQGNNYNWGYDPHNYFTPEGMYSENPSDPQLRIAELKELIHEIHKLGMGVILDNVYNHTARISILEDIVPNYYHFMDKDGNPKSSYGGGRLGTTHAMSRKLMLDSIEYWVKEYKVDGFRFDLMGDLDAESVQMAFDIAVKHNPNMIFIGEGWRTYVGDDGDKRVPADQDWMNQTDSAACFSDEMRNELKSGFGSEGQPRFITGGKRSIRTIFDNICGRPGNMTADDPGDVVQYIAAHDNLTLHDVIAQSIRKDPLIPENQVEIHKRIRLGNALVLTSQGIAFLHAGQEYGRTKHWLADGVPEDKFTTVQGFKYPHFIHDSYDSSDIINHIDWDKIEQPGLPQYTINYTKGLIELRKSTDAFRLGSADLVKTNVNLIKCFQIGKEDLAIAYSCQSTNGEKYFIFMNCDTKKRIFATELNLKNGIVVVDSDEAGISEVTELSGAEFTASNTIALEPLTVIIIKD